MRLIRALRILINGPYTTNGNERGHEKMICEVLRKNGFIEIDRNQLSKEQIEQIKRHDKNVKFKNFPRNFFIWEPVNNNSSPDFFICEGKVKLYLDAKSSKKNRPMWNSGMPKPETVYLFTTPKGTHLFCGDFYNKEQLENFEKVKEEVAKLTKRLNAKYNLDQVKYWARPVLVDTHPGYLDEKEMSQAAEKALKRIMKLYGN